MRDIKFRGKTFKGEWITGDLFRTPGNTGDGVAIQYWDETDGWMNEDVQVESIGQWTGLYDDYDVPIFEGDVIETDIDNSEHIGRLMVVSDGPKTLKGVVRYDLHSAKFQIFFEKNVLAPNTYIVSAEFGWGGKNYHVIGKFFDDKFKLQSDIIK